MVGRRIEELALPPARGRRHRARPARPGQRGRREAGQEVIIAHHDTVVRSRDHVIVFVPRKRMVREVEKLFQVGATFF
jgi:trk system potassium uptake protein